MNIEIEIYKKNGKKYVFISHDGSSGCKYKFENENDLTQKISDYIKDNYDENELEEEE